MHTEPNLHPTQICLVESQMKESFSLSFVCWFYRQCYSKTSLCCCLCCIVAVKVCSKIIGLRQNDLCSLLEERIVQKAKGTINQPNRVLAREFLLMPSGWLFTQTLLFFSAIKQPLNADSSPFRLLGQHMRPLECRHDGS